MLSPTPRNQAPRWPTRGDCDTGRERRCSPPDLSRGGIVSSARHGARVRVRPWREVFVCGALCSPSRAFHGGGAALWMGLGVDWRTPLTRFSLVDSDASGRVTGPGHAGRDVTSAAARGPCRGCGALAVVSWRRFHSRWYLILAFFWKLMLCKSFIIKYWFTVVMVLSFELCLRKMWFDPFLKYVFFLIWLMAYCRIITVFAVHCR